MARPLKRFVLRAAVLLAVATAALSSDIQIPVPVAAAPSEFQFVRLIYSDVSYAFGRGDHWMTDVPGAEEHLIPGLKRLTRINVADEGIYMSLMDDRLFDYPWIYAVEVGYWYLSDAEAARLRDYLLRGGMLVVDDFHGTQEWANFVDNIRRVFPDRPIVDIPRDDVVFHLAFDLTDGVQIPGVQYLYTGRLYERDGYEPHWRGIYDDNGNLMVVINHNMDLGDAWENADVPDYALQYTTRAYQYAINYVLYAMTH